MKNNNLARRIEVVEHPYIKMAKRHAQTVLLTEEEISLSLAIDTLPNDLESLVEQLTFWSTLYGETYEKLLRKVTMNFSRETKVADVKTMLKSAAYVAALQKKIWEETGVI